MLEFEYYDNFLELVTEELRTLIRSQDHRDALLGEQVLELLHNGVALSEAQFQPQLGISSSNRLLRGTLH